MAFNIPPDVDELLAAMDPLYMLGQGQEMPQPGEVPTHLNYINWLRAKWVRDQDGDLSWMDNPLEVRSLLWLHKRMLGAALMDGKNRPLQDDFGNPIKRDLKLSRIVDGKRVYISEVELKQKLRRDIELVRKYRPDELYVILCHYPSSGDVGVRRMLRDERENLRLRRKRIHALEAREKGDLAHLFVPDRPWPAPVRVVYHSPGNVMLLRVDTHKAQCDIGGETLTMWCNAYRGPSGLKHYKRYQGYGPQYVMLFPKTGSMYAATFDPKREEQGESRTLEFLKFLIDNHDNIAAQPVTLFEIEAARNANLVKAVPEMLAALSDDWVANRRLDANAIDGLFRLYQAACALNGLKTLDIMMPAIKRLMETGDPRVFRVGLQRCKEEMKGAHVPVMAALQVNITEHALQNNLSAHDDTIATGLITIAANQYVRAVAPGTAEKAEALAHAHIPRILAEGDNMLQAGVLNALSPATHPNRASVDTHLLDVFTAHFCPVIIKNTSSMPLAEAAASKMRMAGLTPPSRPVGGPLMVVPAKAKDEPDSPG